jgi:DNA/RNA endonuclease YhcR with UshA esterase domain/predicted small lipoprotein YifL
MKRLIASVLALVLCFGLLAGCGTDEPQASTPVAEPTETQPVETTPVQEEPDTAAEDVKSAAAYLKAMYKESEAATPYDFERLGVVRVANVPYTVVWTADVAAVTATDNGDGTVTINVDEAVTEETKYVLTATVSDEAGNTASVSFDHYIPASLGDAAEILEMAYALEQGAALEVPVTLTGVITAIDTPYDAGYKNVSVVMAVEGHEDKPVLCYRLKGEGAENLFPGDTITVSGIIKNYKGTIEFDAGCTLISVVKGENTFELPSEPSEIVKMAYELKPGESIPVKVTLTGMIGYIKTPYSAAYNNITPIIIVDGDWAHPITCFRMKGAGADQIWKFDTITVTGTIKNYNGTIEFDAGCTMDSWENTGADVPLLLTADEILDYANKNLKDGETMQGTYSLSGRVQKVDSAYDPMYGNETITLRVPLANNKYQDVLCYRIFTGAKNIEAGDYVTIRGSLMKYKGAVQFGSGSFTTKYDPTTLAEALVEASKLKNGQYLSYNESVTGTVKINTAYSSQYKNITFTVTDAEGNQVYCYRVKGEGMDTLKNGDTVIVTGNLTAYNGKAQFDSKAKVTVVKDPVTPPVTPEQPQQPFPATLAEQIAAANKLANGSYLNGNSTITGVVEIKEAYTEQYKNVSIWVTNSDGVKLQAHRVKGFAGIETLANGDTVTVTGPLTAYNGTAQFDYMSTVTIVSKAPTTDPDEPVTPPVTPDPDEPATEKTVTYTFSFGGTGGTTATAAGLKTAFTTSDLAVESVSNVNKMFQGYKKSNSTDGAAFEGTNFLKSGNSSTNGTFTLNFPSNVKISKVVVNAHAWKSGASDKITVNGVQKTASGSGTPTDLVFELSTPSNVLSFTCAKRCFIFSVTVTFTQG